MKVVVVLIVGMLFSGVDYITQIQPIFSDDCGGCHTINSSGGLNLSSYDQLIDGGDGGAVVVPGDAQSSSLYDRITRDDSEAGDMPPSGSLAADDINLIAQWIDEGALEEASECDSGYSFYDGFNQNTTIVFDGSNCFFDSDLEFLQDLIDLNSLDINSPLDIGTQNWLGGRLLYVKAGNDFDGGNVLLTALPESIGNLSQVQTLSLAENNIGELPGSITSLNNLANLILSFNGISSLPEDIGNLSNLYFLDLGYNQLEYIPTSIGNLENLEYLWLFDNNLSSLPDSICSLNLVFSCSGDEPCVDALFAPYFGCGGNMLCEEIDVPECVSSSNNFEISLDVFYYSFIIESPQDCEDCVAGDVNSDSTINILDVVSIVQYVLGNIDYSDDQICSANINGDASVNILDIVALVQLILG